MKRRLVIFCLIILSVFFVGSGIYFVYKSFYKNKLGRPAIAKLYYDSSRVILLKESAFDFENENSSGYFTISNEADNSGKKGCIILPEQEYCGQIIQQISDIPSYEELKQVEVRFDIRNENKSDGLLWVLEIIDEKGKGLYWESDIPPVTLQKWVKASLHFTVKPELLTAGNKIKMYVWNKNKSKVYLDDLKISYQGLIKTSDLAISNSIKPTSFFYDLENDSGLEKTETLSEEKSHSGKRSSYMDGSNQYSVWICKRVSEIMNDTIKSLFGSVWLYPLSENRECALVFEIRNSNDEQKYWNGKSTEKIALKAGSWQKLNLVFNLAAEDYRKINPDDRICVYVYNNSNTKLYADDFEISFGNIPEPRGEKTFVEMNELKSDSYQFDRYHPPFRISGLIKDDIHNGDSPNLINIDSIKLGNIKPGQEILTGNFSGVLNGRDELLVISEKDIQIFHFCKDKQRFVISGKTLFDESKYKTPYFTAGDFNGDGKTELLIISGDKSEMIGFSTAAKNECSDNFSELKITLLWEGNIGYDFNKILAGNFYGNKNSELLLTDNKGNWIIKEFANKEWKTISANKSMNDFGDKAELSAGQFISSRHDVILSVYFEKDAKSCALISLEEKTPKKILAANSDMMKYVFNDNADYYPLHDGTGLIKDILAINHTDRFSIKKISHDKTGFYVSSISEFSGYKDDQNPKFYEFSKIIPGTFEGKETSLLCILYNCSDKNFDGRNCKEYDSLPNLPNSIQLYNFSK